MGLFDRAGGLFGRNKGGAEEFYARNNNRAPDFLGRDKDGSLFGGFGSAQENTTPSVAENTTPAAPNMDFGGGGGGGMFGGIVPDQGGEANIQPVNYPAIPNNGDPNSPLNKPGDNSPGRIPSDQSDPYPQQGETFPPVAAQQQQAQQQNPFFGMQNPISNMFGMGQAMNPYMGGMMNPMMGMMNPFMGGGMFNPMMGMMGMMNPFMNPFAMMGGMGGMFGGMGGALGNMFGGGMPQMQMPRRPMQRYGRNNFQDNALRELIGGPQNRYGFGPNETRIFGPDRVGREQLAPRRVGDFVAREPNYGAFLNPDGSVSSGMKSMDFQDRDGDGMDDRYQRGPNAQIPSGESITDGRFGGNEYYTDLNPGSGNAFMAIEPGYRNGQKGYYTDSSRNTFVVDGNTYDGPDYGPADTMMYTQDMPAAGYKYVYDQQGRRHEVPNYRMTPEDNMMIQDTSDPQGEAEAEAYVMQMINDPIYGADIMRSLNTMF